MFQCEQNGKPTVKITAGIFLQSSFTLHTLVSEIRSTPSSTFFFFPSAKHYLVTAGYADFHRYKWLRLQTRRSNCCRINLHHIQTSKPPALFHTPWISQSLKLGYQTCNSLWVFLILSIVYAEISPKFTSQNCTVPLF